ncbi:hypothetical protein BDR03DRAFT_946931 [Suillus americanus]|nr:hypothetical protein BDR03DRAFT_946931 [Suillus americanus]
MLFPLMARDSKPSAASMLAKASTVAACMAIALDAFCPSTTASTITKSWHLWWARERAAVRPAGPAPTISTVVLLGRDIVCYLEPPIL